MITNSPPMKRSMQLVNRPLSEIPSHMMLEILCRLPIKTCLTCKLVCKEWYHIIISRDFSTFRRTHNINVARHTFLFYKRAYVREQELQGLDFQFAELDKPSYVDVGVDALVRVTPKIAGISNVDLYMASHCNGVVVLINRNKLDGNFYVCNLLTSNYLTVKPHFDSSYKLRYCMLGCCPTTRQFKLFILVRKTNSGGKNETKIQTVGTNEWRRVVNSPCLKWGSSTCFLNGAAHWFASKYIWSFDFTREKFVSMPVPTAIRSYKYKDLTVFDSCLCLSCLSYPHDGNFRDIWVMRKYGVKESWVKQFVLQWGACDWDVPLVHIDEKTLLISRKRSRRILYDLSGQEEHKKQQQLPQLSSFDTTSCEDVDFSKVI